MFFDVLYKIFIVAKPLCVVLDGVDRFNKGYSEIKYSVLLGSEKYDAIFERIRYLIELKSEISYVASHNY